MNDRPRTKRRYPRVIRWIAGGTCLLLGVVGLFVPILQGLLFLALGAVLLSPEVPLFRRIAIGLKRRFPRLRRHLRKLESSAPGTTG